jgi:hypothetical protein
MQSAPCCRLTAFRQLTSNEHRNDGEDLFVVGIRRHVTEADTRQTGAREEQRRYVRRGIVWNVGKIFANGIVELVRQLEEPTCRSNIKYAHRNACMRLGNEASLKYFRKTAALFLESHVIVAVCR